MVAIAAQYIRQTLRAELRRCRHLVQAKALQNWLPGRAASVQS